MRVDYSMFEGFAVRAMRGPCFRAAKVIVDGGKFLAKAGRGHYLKRTARAAGPGNRRKA